MKSLWKQLPAPRGGALWSVLLSLLVLLPAWYLLGNWYQSNLIQQERAKAAEQISARANALVLAVDQRIALLQGLYAFTRTEWPDTEFDLTFEIYSAGIYFNTTGVRTLMIAPEGIARYIFPISDAPELSGYDILHDPDPARRANVQRAIHSRAITLSQPGELRQGGFGLTAWEAVYRGKDLWGLVSIAVDLNTILKDAGLIGPSGELDMSLQDSTGRTFFGPQALWQRDPVVQSIALPEGAWALGGAPQGGWQAAVRDQANVFRAGSLLIVALISLIVYLTVNRQGQLREAVALRTRQIAAAQLALEQRVQERTQELDALQDVSRRIGSTLALDPLLRQILAEIKPVLDYTSAFIFWLDESGGLKLLNAAGEARSAGEGPDFSPVYEGLLEEVRESLQPRIEWDWAGGEGALVKGCRMGVPLVIKDRLNGLLVLVHPEPHFYEEEEARLALAFAQQIAVAIEKARLYEQAGRLAVLEERQRLARELHDSVSQVLYSIGLGAKTAQTALRRDPSQSAEALDYVNRLAEAGQVEMHALIFELRPESLRAEGLVTALERQAAVLRARHQITVQARFCPEPGVPLEVKETLYRVSQEAMHNIVKHAQASQVSLALACSEKQICLEVSDNGVGFDPAAPRPGHLGLRSMHERAVRYQGQVLIDSAPGRGTRVTFVIPLKGGN